MTHAAVEETGQVEAIKDASKERYRAEVRRRRFGFYEVQLRTTHTIRPVGERGEALPTWDYTTELESPPVVFGERWARWTARRMVAAAHRRDRREGQPWVET